jgi:uncharacterized protein (DUF1501 family)
MNECGCNDWMTTQRSAMLRAQGQRVPLPRAILEGANAAVCRRDFLRNGAIGFLTVYGASSLSWGSVWEAASAQAAAGPSTDPIIVSIFLDGGNDGINTLVPIDSTNYAAYLAARPNIGFKDQSALLPLGGAAANPDFAWNPAATGLQSLYDAGKMAVIPAVDYSPPDLSHFHSRAFWQAGYLNTDPTTGWLGRWIDQNGDPKNPLQALSVNWTLEESMRTAKHPVAVLTSPDDAQFGMNQVWQDPDLMTTTLGNLAKRTGGNPAMQAANTSVGGAVSVANRLKSLGTTTIPPTGFGYGTSDFDNQMSTLSWMIRSNLGIRVACLSYDGGFDFHDTQVTRQADNLAGLGQTLAAFQADLEANGLGNRVITLVWSEFGRRIEDNDSGGGGTDHGAGGLAMVIGSGVKAGVATEFPGLTDLDGNGNLKVPTDYRQIYTELLGSWMGTDPAAVIPDSGKYAPLALVA